MIFDGENSLCDATTLSSALTVSPNVINMGKGESYEPMKLANMIKDGTGTSPTMTVKIQTATDAAFTTPVDLATFTLSGTGDQVKTLPIPRGNLGYLRLAFSDGSYTGGKLTAGLVVDDDIPHRK
jgi:hypothetical protein